MNIDRLLNDLSVKPEEEDSTSRPIGGLGSAGLERQARTLPSFDYNCFVPLNAARRSSKTSISASSSRASTPRVRNRRVRRSPPSRANSRLDQIAGHIHPRGHVEWQAPSEDEWSDAAQAVHKKDKADRERQSRKELHYQYCNLQEALISQNPNLSREAVGEDSEIGWKPLNLNNIRKDENRRLQFNKTHVLSSSVAFLKQDCALFEDIIPVFVSMGEHDLAERITNCIRARGTPNWHQARQELLQYVNTLYK